MKFVEAIIYFPLLRMREDPRQGKVLGRPVARAFSHPINFLITMRTYGEDENNGLPNTRSHLQFPRLAG